MKKTLLFSAFAALTLGAAAQTAILKDVTPAGLDFSKYEDGQLFKIQHPSAGDESFAGWSPVTTIYDPSVMAQEGHFSTFVRRGVANTNAQFEKDAAVFKIRDLGGSIGKCLVLSSEYAPLANKNAATEGAKSINGPWDYYSGGGNGSYCLSFFSDPTTHHHGYTGAAVRVRITYTMLRRARHANGAGLTQPVMMGMYCLEGNDGNYAPREDGSQGATVTFPGSKYAVFEGEGDCVAEMTSDVAKSGVGVADPFDAPNTTNDEYTMQVKRFHVVEFDTYSVGEANPIIFCLNWVNSHVSVIIKEIKFFEIQNPMELLDPANGNAPIPGASYVNTRVEGYRYYTEKGLQEFADGGVPRPVKAGSKENPYKLSTTDDVLAMASKIKANEDYYFVLENDIDMEGVEGFTPVVQNAPFDGVMHFDGQNHVIKNLKITSESEYTSFFGVLKGEVKNFGLVNCTVNGPKAAILGGYGAHNSYSAATTIDNVFVTGSVTSDGGFNGGMIGSTGSTLKITNSYANVKVSNEGGNCGILVGRVNNPLTVENCYVAGSSYSQSNAGGLLGFSTADAEPVVNNAAVLNATIEGWENQDAVFNGIKTNINGVLVADNVKIDGATAEGAKPAAEVVAVVQGWDAFHNLNTIDGLPVLTWQTADSGVIGVGVDEDVNAAPVYYNLQGVQVANPENGLYIVKRGNKVAKEIIR